MTEPSGQRRPFLTVGVRMRSFGSRLLRYYAKPMRATQRLRIPPTWQAAVETPLIWREEAADTLPEEITPESPPTVDKTDAARRVRRKKAAPPPPQEEEVKVPSLLRERFQEHLQRDRERTRIREERKALLDAPPVMTKPAEDTPPGEAIKKYLGRRSRASFDYVATSALQSPEEMAAETEAKSDEAASDVQRAVAEPEVESASGATARDDEAANQEEGEADFAPVDDAPESPVFSESSLPLNRSFAGEEYTSPEMEEATPVADATFNLGDEGENRSLIVAPEDSPPAPKPPPANKMSHRGKAVAGEIARHVEDLPPGTNGDEIVHRAPEVSFPETDSMVAEASMFPDERQVLESDGESDAGSSDGGVIASVAPIVTAQRVPETPSKISRQAKGKEQPTARPIQRSPEDPSAPVTGLASQPDAQIAETEAPIQRVATISDSSSPKIEEMGLEPSAAVPESGQWPERAQRISEESPSAVDSPKLGQSVGAEEIAEQVQRISEVSPGATDSPKLEQSVGAEAVESSVKRVQRTPEPFSPGEDQMESEPVGADRMVFPDRTAGPIPPDRESPVSGDNAVSWRVERVEPEWITSIPERSAPRPATRRAAPTPQPTTDAVKPKPEIRPKARAIARKPAESPPDSLSPASPEMGPTAPENEGPPRHDLLAEILRPAPAVQRSMPDAAESDQEDSAEGEEYNAPEAGIQRQPAPVADSEDDWIFEGKPSPDEQPEPHAMDVYQALMAAGMVETTPPTGESGYPQPSEIAYHPDPHESAVIPPPTATPSVSLPPVVQRVTTEAPTEATEESEEIDEAAIDRLAQGVYRVLRRRLRVERERRDKS